MSNVLNEQQQFGLAENAVNTYSHPSDLKITDMRIAVVCSNYDYPIIRIDTNQGIYGIGKVRDAGHKENALQFKSMLLGQNPCIVGQSTRGEYAMVRYSHAPGSGQGVKLTQKGINADVEVVAAVGKAVGDGVSLCTDHFGHGYPTAKEVIRLSEVLEPYNLAWLEDPMPRNDVQDTKV